MPRCKIAMRLIEGPRARAATYARRAKGIKKKAEELAKFCGVPVALVCAAGAAGALPLEWESEEGVLDRYRALPPEVRAQHTLRNHLVAELGKERAKLARVQQHGPGALADMDAPLGDMTLAEAWELLETIDAALSAVRKRLEALGLAADSRLEQIAADDVMAQLGHDGLHCIGTSGGDMDIGFQLQMAPPYAGKNDNVGKRLEEFSWDDRYQMRNADMSQPGLGLQCTGGNYLGAVNGYGQMQTPGYVCPDLTMCHDGSSNGVLPVPYYPTLRMGVGGHFSDGTAAPEQSAIVSGGEYSNAAPLRYAMGMGMGGNFMWQPAQVFQRGDDDTSTSQAAASPQCSTPGTVSFSKVFRHL